MVHWTYKVGFWIGCLSLWGIIAFAAPTLPSNYTGPLAPDTVPSNHTGPLAPDAVPKNSNQHNTSISNQHNTSISNRVEIKNDLSDDTIPVTANNKDIFDSTDVPTLDKLDSLLLDSTIKKVTPNTKQQPGKSSKGRKVNDRQSKNIVSGLSDNNLNPRKDYIKSVTQAEKKIDRSYSKKNITVHKIQQTLGGKENLPSSKIDSDVQYNSFTRNETIMLGIPDDDVVEGKLTEKARLKMISYHEYTQELQQQIQERSQQKLGDAIDYYLLVYNKSFLYHQTPEKMRADRDSAIQEAILSLLKNDLENFRVIIDNYPIINTELEDGNNFLHLAVLYNKLDFARYLLSKGINDKKYNDYHLTPYMIANVLRKFDMVRLMLNAEINAAKYF